MDLTLSSAQEREQAVFRSFVEQHLIPCADRYDRQERLPAELIAAMAAHNWLGALLPSTWGGRDMDLITFGLLHQELGRGCASTRTLLTAHNMVAHALHSWGSDIQKERWLPQLASGEVLAAFALSEPQVGSDARNVETTARPVSGGYLLNGYKKWISFGQIADLFLLFAQLDGELAAFLLPRSSKGLSIQPNTGLLGLRAAMLAELHLSNCQLPKQALLGRPGLGGQTVLFSALEIGRYAVAWGCVGLAQACLEASLHYASQRRQFGVLLQDHQLIQAMIADMVVDTQAARLLCYQAGRLLAARQPEAVNAVLVAKYAAARTALKTAGDAVQIHGAEGCGTDYPVQRHWRDAKIMQLIEGSTQILQIAIAKQAAASR